MVISYTAVLAVPIIFFCSLYYGEAQRKNQEWTDNYYQESAGNIVGVLDRKFLDVLDLGDRLLATNWIQRLCSDSEIIWRYFDNSRMADISSELRIHMTSLGVADQLVILLPRKGQAVSLAGWEDAEDILAIAGIKDKSGQKELWELLGETGWFSVLEAGECGVIPGSEDLLVVQSLDMLNSPRAYMLIRIGKTTLDNYLARFRFGELMATAIVDREGGELYCYRPVPEGEAARTMEIPSELFPWTYRIELAKVVPTNKLEQFAVPVLALILSLVLGYLAAYLLAVVSYRPIRGLVNRIGGDRRKPEFQTISDAFDQLTEERETLEAALRQHQADIRNNLLSNLLHGWFAGEKTKTQMEELDIAYNDSQFFTVLLFKCQEVKTEQQRFTLLLNIKAGLMTEQMDFDLVETMDGDVVGILRFNKPQGAEAVEQLIQKLPLHVYEKMEVTLRIFCGTEEKGLIGVSRSYQVAKEKSVSLNFPAKAPARQVSGARCYYPTDWELQLVNNLKLGNEDAALNILDELCRENERRQLSPAQQARVVGMIFDTIQRVMDELEMELPEALAFFEEEGAAAWEEQWACLTELARKICGRACYARESSEETAGEQILRYVDEHFDNAELSLQVLGDQLGLSVSAVSRIFKATVKINFSNYLCRVRMEKAKEYLQTTDAPIAEIARLVGYENELSFKRAFVRYEGIRPKEYRER